MANIAGGALDIGQNAMQSIGNMQNNQFDLTAMIFLAGVGLFLYAILKKVKSLIYPKGVFPDQSDGEYANTNVVEKA